MSPVSALTGVMALTAIPPAILAVFVWRVRDEPGAVPYAAMLVVMVAFILTYTVSLGVEGPWLHGIVFSTSGMLKALVTVPWLVFALEYTGRGRLVSRTVVGALLAPIALAVLVTPSPLRTGLMVQNYAIEVTGGVVLSTFDRGPLWFATGVFAFMYLGVGLALLVEFVIVARTQYGLQTAVLAVAGLIPGLASIANLAGVGPVAGLDLTPFAYGAVAPIIGYGQHRWNLFAVAPATRRIGQAAAIDDLGDAVLIVDVDHRVVDVNARAADVLGQSSDALLGAPIADVLDADLDSTADSQFVHLATPRGWRDFSCAVSPVEETRGGTIGYTIVLHDVTLDRQRRQRFEVLNRVLRHNLRNSMNVIVGYSKELGDQVNGQGTEEIARIEQQSTHLVELSQKVRNIDRVTTPTKNPTSVVVATALDRIRRRLADDHHRLDVRLDVDEELTVRTYGVVFEEVLLYAGESVARYNDAPDPELTVAVQPTADNRPWVTCTITSNGAPIPAAEREVIERGEETPLDHTHDLDLWLVSWGVDTLGGELDFLVDADRPGIALTIPNLGPVERPDLARSDLPTR